MVKNNSYFIIHKPYKILSQFTDEDGNLGLGSLYKLKKDVYPVGRLDLDSEGLLILTNDRSLNHKLLNPKHQHWRTYWVEVDGQPDEEALLRFQSGIEINLKGRMYRTKGAKIRIITPELEERNPPVNYKKHPTRTWLEISLAEGKNRQVRKMTAAIGHPTLRLVRVKIENLDLLPMKSGEIRQVSGNVLYKKLNLL